MNFKFNFPSPPSLELAGGNASCPLFSILISEGSVDVKSENVLIRVLEDIGFVEYRRLSVGGICNSSQEAELGCSRRDFHIKT